MHGGAAHRTGLALGQFLGQKPRLTAVIPFLGSSIGRIGAAAGRDQGLHLFLLSVAFLCLGFQILDHRNNVLQLSGRGKKGIRLPRMAVGFFFCFHGGRQRQLCLFKSGLCLCRCFFLLL